MVLGFKKQFVEPILAGTKIHTIRLDLGGRWKEGNSIQFATGVRTPEYYEFKRGVCFRTQEIEFDWLCRDGVSACCVYVDGVLISDKNLKLLSKGDGFFGKDDFLQWDAWNKINFKGKIIHWTDKKY